VTAYEVWASNDEAEWTRLIFETDARDLAFGKAQELFDAGRFKWIAVDHDGRTVWSNDPLTPAKR